MTNEITPRMVLHVGYSCNERCRFCYYRKSLEEGTVTDLTTNEVKNRLRIGRKYGKTAVDISGGEATIRKDIFEIISYAKHVGYKDICMITNGLKTSDKEFCKKLIDAGLTDALFSLHSPKAEIHDYLTQVKGSWDKLIQSMNNMQEFNFKFRINTVVTNLNYKDLGMFFNLIGEFKPTAVNLLVFNPAEEVIYYRDDKSGVTDYNVIAREIKNSLDRYDAEFKINVRFLPFCLLKGYEKNVKTMHQKIYELVEWDPHLFMRFRKGWIYTVGAFLVGFTRFERTPGKGWYTFVCEMIQRGRIWYDKLQVEGCKKCSLRWICPGFPRGYVNKGGEVEVYPYEGEVVEDPNYFLKS